MFESPDPDEDSVEDVQHDDDLWYISPKGSRKKYHFCDQCSYRTPNSNRLITHVEKWHPTESPTYSDFDSQSSIIMEPVLLSAEDNVTTAILRSPEKSFSSDDNDMSIDLHQDEEHDEVNILFSH